MLCTAVSSVIEYIIISFVAGVILTTVLFGRYMVRHRTHQEKK